MKLNLSEILEEVFRYATVKYWNFDGQHPDTKSANIDTLEGLFPHELYHLPVTTPFLV